MIAAEGSGRSANFIPAIPSAWFVTTIAFIEVISSFGCLPCNIRRLRSESPHGDNHLTSSALSPHVDTLAPFYAAIDRNEMQTMTKDFDLLIARTEPEGFPTAGTDRSIAEAQEHAFAAAKGAFASRASHALHLRCQMTWRLLSREDVLEIVADQVAALDPRSREVWDRYRVDLEPIIRVFPANGKEVSSFVLARDGARVLFYDDIEEEFGTGTLVDGRLPNWGTWGEELRWALHNFPESRGSAAGPAQALSTN